MTQELTRKRNEPRVPDCAGVLPGRILVATDGSEDALATTRVAVDIAGRSGSELHAVHVARRLPTYSLFLTHATDELLLREAQRATERHLEEAGGHAARVHARVGEPVEEILATGDEIGAGLLVVHARRLGLLKRALSGDTSEGIARRAACPVLVVPGGETSWPPARVVIVEPLSGGFGAAVRTAVGLGGVYGVDALPVRASSIPDVAAESEVPALVAVDGFGPGSVPTRVLRAADGPILIHAQRRDPTF